MSLSVSANASTIASNATASAANAGNAGTNQPSNSASSSSAPKVSFDNETITYPEKLLTSQSDYLKIKAIEYTPPNKGGATFGDSEYQKLKQEDLRSLRKEKSKGIVILPMPGKVTDVNAVNWGDKHLSPVQAITVGAVGTVADPGAGALNLLNTVGNALKDPGKSLSELGGAAGYGGALAAYNALNSTPLAVTPDELLARSTGFVANPNAELLFAGPRLRGYNFSYILVPRNKIEAQRIRKIVRFFKQSMLPPKNGILLSTPYVFFLEYLRKNGSSMKTVNKFKPCALSDFNVDYTGAGEGWNSYYDEDEDISQPIATTIQMKFLELTPIFRDSYDEFSSSDDVGY